jgi:ribulose-phosphate 3-epimerase
MTETRPRAIVSPSVLAADFTKLGEETLGVLIGDIPWIHLDVMDGKFVPNISFGFPVIKSLSDFLNTHGHEHVVRDVHMMVEDPLKWVADLKSCGASHVTFHIEACPDIDYAIRCARAIRAAGMTAGISVKPGTDVDVSLDLIGATEEEGLFSLLLVMTVEPGFGGQKFNSSVLSKCRSARLRFPNLNIQTDGGVNDETALLCAKSGANNVVAGTSVFRDPHPRIAAERLRGILKVTNPQLV